MTYIFRRGPGRLGYRVIRESDGAELGIVVPAPTKKWTVWAGDGKSYGTRMEAAGAMDHAAVEVPLTNREWRYGDVVVVDNRKLDRVQIVFPHAIPRKKAVPREKKERMVDAGFRWHAAERAWQRLRSEDSLESALGIARGWSEAPEPERGGDSGSAAVRGSTKSPDRQPETGSE